MNLKYLENFLENFIMSHSKIAKLVAEVSKELQIDIPDVDRMTIMQEVRNLVKTNHPVPELMNSDDESENEQESDVEFVGVTEGKDDESSVSDVIEILSDEKSNDSPLSMDRDVSPVNEGAGQGFLSVVEGLDNVENDIRAVVEMDNVETEATSDCEYEETVDDSPGMFADDQNAGGVEDSGTIKRHSWREIRKKFSRKNPWVTRKRRKKKGGLIVRVLNKSKIPKLKSCVTGTEIPHPIVVFKQTNKTADEDESEIPIFSVKKTSDIIKESMKKYPGVILKDVKVRLQDCITDSDRYKLLLNHIKEQQLKEAAEAKEVDIQEECKNGLFFKCGVALKDKFAYNWGRTQTCPEPLRIAWRVSQHKLKTDKIASLSQQTAATEREKLEIEWIGTDPAIAKNFENQVVVHNDYGRDSIVRVENNVDEMNLEFSEWTSETKPDLANLKVQGKSDTDLGNSDILSEKKNEDSELDPVSGEVTGRRLVLDPVTGEFTFDDSIDNIKEEPVEETDTGSHANTEDTQTAKETVNDKSDKTRSVSAEGNVDDNILTFSNTNSKALDCGVKLRGAELIYTCTTIEGVLPIEQIESAIHKDIESRRGTEDNNWKQLKTTLAERVDRIEKLMGTISEENKDGEIDQFKHYALQKARAELESVKEQTGLIKASQAAKPVHMIMESSDDEASSDSNFSVSNLITNDEEEVAKAEERGLKRKRADFDQSLIPYNMRKRTNEVNYKDKDVNDDDDDDDGGFKIDKFVLSLDEEFVYLREINPIQPAVRPVRDVKFLGKFDMLIRRELYKTMLAPNLSHDDFDKAMASIMGVPLETGLLEVVEGKMNTLKIKLRQTWMDLIDVIKFRKNHEDQVKKSRIQAKSLEYLRGRIYDNLKPCILKSFSYQKICRMILICLSEILDRDRNEIIEVYHDELELIHEEEEKKKRRDSFSAQFEDIQAKEAIRLKKINMLENMLAKHKKLEAERLAALEEAKRKEEEMKRKAEEPVVIDLVEDEEESNKKGTKKPEPSKRGRKRNTGPPRNAGPSNIPGPSGITVPPITLPSIPGPSKQPVQPMDAASIKQVHDMLMNKLHTGAAETLEGTYSVDNIYNTRGRRKPYKRKPRLMNAARKDMSNIRTESSPLTMINPESLDLQNRCPLLFFKLQQHVKTSLERSTGDLLSNSVRENLAYRIATSYASDHAEELKLLEQMVQKQQSSGLSTREVQEGLDYIIEQNIDDDDDEEDDHQNSRPNIKQSSSPPPPPSSGNQEQNLGQNASAPGVQYITIKQEPVEGNATMPSTQSAANPHTQAITNLAVAALPAQFEPTPSAGLSLFMGLSGLIDGQNAAKTVLANRLQENQNTSKVASTERLAVLDSQNSVKNALANRLAAGLPQMTLKDPHTRWPFAETSIPEQTKTALADKLKRNLEPYQTSTTRPNQTSVAQPNQISITQPNQRSTTLSTTQSTSDVSTTVKYPRERGFPFATNNRPKYQIPATTIYNPPISEAQLSTVTSMFPQGTDTMVVDATVPPEPQGPLNIKQIAKQNQQDTAGQPVALQPAYIGGSNEQIFVPVFPSTATNSDSGIVSTSMSESPMLAKLLSASKIETAARKLLPELYPGGNYSQTPTTPSPDTAAATTPKPSPYQQVRPVALHCASPNLLPAGPPGVASPALQQVRPVRTPSPAAGAQVRPVGTPSPTVAPQVRPGTTPSPLTQQASAQNSQFCQLPVPSIQLADFLAMQLRAQIEAANKIAEGDGNISLNLPFMNNNEEIMAALNAPILQAMDSPLLAALNSTVIKALEGSLAQTPNPVQNQPDEQAVPPFVGPQFPESPSVSNPDTPPVIILESGEESMSSTADSEQPSSSSPPPTGSQPVRSQSPEHSGAPVISGSLLVPEDSNSSVETRTPTSIESTKSCESPSLCSSSDSLTTSVVPAVSVVSAVIVSTPTSDSNVQDTSVNTLSTESGPSSSPSQVIEMAKEDTAAPETASTVLDIAKQAEEISSSESKDVSDDVEQKADDEDDLELEVYTFEEPNNTMAFAKALEFLESNTKDGNSSLGEEDSISSSNAAKNPNTIESKLKKKIEYIPSALGASVVEIDDPSQGASSGVLEIASEEPGTVISHDDQDSVRVGSGDEMTSKPSDKGPEPLDDTDIECVESDRNVNTLDASTEDTATASESEQASVCTILSYGSLAPQETPTDGPSQGTTLRDLLCKPNGSKVPSVKPSVVMTPIGPIKNAPSKLSTVSVFTEGTLSASKPTSSPSRTKSAASFPTAVVLTPSLGELLSKTASVMSSQAPNSTIKPSADAFSSTSASSEIPRSVTEMRIPPGFLAAPLDGAFRVTLPDETINKIIEDAIKSVGTMLTPKAQALVRSQLDRISVPKGIPNVPKSCVKRDIAPAVMNSATDTASSGQSDVETSDGSMAASGTRRNDPFFKLPLSGVRPIRNVAEDGTISWTCTVCGKSFSRNFTYRRHAETHMNIKPWKCDICSKAFGDKRYLMKHMRWHTGEDLQHCDDCGRAFSDELALFKHKRVHTSDKSFQCDRNMCQKVFADAHTLKRHIQHVHEQRKTHKCELCNLMFVFKSHLDDHMKRHTGEKPHRCSICGKGFIQVGTRNRHERQHKAGDPYKCTICMNIFWFKGELKSHFESMHPGIEIPEAHKALFSEDSESAQNENVSEEENRTRLTHIPREQYTITSGTIVSGEAGSDTTSDLGPPKLTLVKEEYDEVGDFIPDALAPNPQIPELLNEGEAIPEIEAKGNIKDLIAATIEPAIYDATVKPVICNVETVTDPDTKEHLRELVRQQEERDRLASEKGRQAGEKGGQASEKGGQASEKGRLASEDVLRASQREEEKDRHVSEQVAKLSKQQEEADRLAREEIIRLSNLLYKKDTKRSIKNQDKNTSEKSGPFPIRVKTEPIDVEFSDSVGNNTTAVEGIGSIAANQHLSNFMKPQTATPSTSKTTDHDEQNTIQVQSIPNIKDISRGITVPGRGANSTWLQTKSKLQNKTDKIASLMELFREKGVPKEEKVSGGNESEDSD